LDLFAVPQFFICRNRVPVIFILARKTLEGLERRETRRKEKLVVYERVRLRRREGGVIKDKNIWSFRQGSKNIQNYYLLFETCGEESQGLQKERSKRGRKGQTRGRSPWRKEQKEDDEHRKGNN